MYVDSIIGMLVVFGMADSLQPAISHCYGAGLMDKVKAIFRRIILGAIVLSAASLLFMMFAGRYVAPLVRQTRGYRVAFGQHHRYEAVLAFLSYGLGRYVFLILFHGT